jgi:hypothetical protein
VPVTYAPTVSESVSFMEFVRLLSGDERVRSDFEVDPDGTLSTFGLDDLSPADVRDAIALVEDNRTVDWADAYGSGAGSADALAFGSGTGPTRHPDHLDPGALHGAAPDIGADTLGATSDALDRAEISALHDEDPIPLDDVIPAGNSVHDHAGLHFL